MPGFDIAVIDLAPAGSFSRVSPGLAPSSGQQAVVSGLAKLAQSVMFLFATEQGSVAFDRELGASPVRTILRRNNLDRDVIESAIAASAQRISNQIRAFGGTTASPDEQLGSLLISTKDFDAETGQVSLQIEITSAAGNNAAYQLSFTIPNS